MPKLSWSSFSEIKVIEKLLDLTSAKWLSAICRSPVSLGFYIIK